MPLVDWSQHVSGKVWKAICVDYSHLQMHHDPFELDQDVARIRLGNGFIVDIEWSDEDEVYYVTLSRQFYEYDIIKTSTANVGEVIQLVSEWADYYSRDSMAVSDASDTNAEIVCKEHG